LAKLNLGVLTALSSGNSQPTNRTKNPNLSREGRRTAILIPVFENWQWTERCLRAVYQTEAALVADVYVVDDCSTTPRPDRLLDQFKDVKWSRNKENLGFLRSCNRFLETFDPQQHEFVLLLNNDTEPQPGFLAELLRVMDEKKEVGMVGSKLLFGDGRLQEAGGIIFSDGTGWNFGRNDNPNRSKYNKFRLVDYCTGASILIRLNLFKSLGFFDERYAPAYFEDSDLAFAIRLAGFDVAYCPNSVVIHHESKTYGSSERIVLRQNQLRLNRLKFVEKWREQMSGQLYPNILNVAQASSRATVR
jgi:GT2 family glycosyltransferase